MAKSAAQVEQDLKEYVKLLTSNFNIFAVVLYGSYAEGKANEFSDIDVAVFSDDFGKNPLEEMIKLFKLRRKIDPDIEPLPFAKKDFFEHTKADFISQILRSGKIIYREGKLLI